MRAACFWAAVANTAGAQPFLARPVSIVVPYSPGGETDVIGRTIAARLKIGRAHV